VAIAADLDSGEDRARIAPEARAAMTLDGCASYAGGERPLRG
jgi:hypothetical protein